MKTFVYIFLSLMILPLLSEAALYRWVDSKGKVHYSDQVPPEEAKHERKVIDESSGRTIETIERSKTQQELQELKRLQAQMAEERKRAKIQADRDRVLLLTYQSVSEIVAARNTKISTIDLAKEHAMDSRKSQIARLREIRQKAADFERSSRPIPKAVLDEIKAQELQIAHTDEYIKAREQDQDRLRKEFAGYIARYKELTE
jgi:hypothetical protein